MNPTYVLHWIKSNAYWLQYILFIQRIHSQHKWKWIECSIAIEVVFYYLDQCQWIIHEYESSWNHSPSIVPFCNRLFYYHIQINLPVGNIYEPWLQTQMKSRGKRERERNKRWKNWNRMLRLAKDRMWKFECVRKTNEKACKHIHTACTPHTYT